MVSEISCQNSTLSFTIVCYFLLCCHSLWCKNMVRDLMRNAYTFVTNVPFWVIHLCWESHRAANSNDVLTLYKELSYFRKKCESSMKWFCTFDVVWLNGNSPIYFYQNNSWRICKIINCMFVLWVPCTYVLESFIFVPNTMRKILSCKLSSI